MFPDRQIDLEIRSSDILNELMCILLHRQPAYRQLYLPNISQSQPVSAIPLMNGNCFLTANILHLKFQMLNFHMNLNVETKHIDMLIDSVQVRWAIAGPFGNLCANAEKFNLLNILTESFPKINTILSLYNSIASWPFLKNCLTQPRKIGISEIKTLNLRLIVEKLGSLATDWPPHINIGLENCCLCSIFPAIAIQNHDHQIAIFFP